MAKSRNRKKKKKGGNRSNLKGDKLIASIIKSKVRSFELYKCYCIESWEDFTILNTITVVKKYGQGKFCMGIFLVDPGCLGLKNSGFRYNIELDEVEDLLEKFYSSHSDDYIEIEYDLANELVWGAIEYAKELGFSPEKDIKLTQYFLCAQKEVTNKYELEFGVDGKPFYFAGPNDDFEFVVRKLTAKLGNGGFEFTHPILDGHPFSGEEEEDFDEDEENNNDFAEDAEVEYLD